MISGNGTEKLFTTKFEILGLVTVSTQNFVSIIGGDSQQEGLAGYRLGSAYEEIGDAETAILVRTKLMIFANLCSFTDFLTDFRINGYLNTF